MTPSPAPTDQAVLPNWAPTIQALTNHGSAACLGNAGVAKEMRAEFEERLELRAGASQIRFIRPDEDPADPENYVLASFTDVYSYVLVIGRRMVKEDTTDPALRSVVLRPLLRQLIAETTPEEELIVEEEPPPAEDQAISDEPAVNADGWQTAKNPLV